MMRQNCSALLQARIQDFGQGGGPRAQDLLDIAWKLHDFEEKKILGARAPLGSAGGSSLTRITMLGKIDGARENTRQRQKTVASELNTNLWLG